MTHSRSTVLTFFILLGVLCGVNLLTPSREYSENENRYLNQRPALRLSAVADGSYMEDFDLYTTDQFAFRDGWVSVKTLTERGTGQRSSGGVYFAADDYLIDMFNYVDIELYRKNLNYVRQFSDKAASDMSIPVSVMLIPTAALAHEDKLPAHAPEVSQTELLREAENTLSGFIDVSQALILHSDEYIYYRTDHHWTSLGAFYAYNSFREQSGMDTRSLESFRQKPLSNQFYGTTYSKANLYTTPPDSIFALYSPVADQLLVEYNEGEETANSIYQLSHLQTKDKYAVFLNANQPLVHIHTGIHNGRRLLVIKDSYFNTFAQMLLEDYEEIAVVDLRYYRATMSELAEENEITDILVLYSLNGFSSDTNLFRLAL